MQEDLETLMPAAAVSQISGLVSLRLRLGLGLGHDGLQDSVDLSNLPLLRSMPHLTALDLSRNSMSQLPRAIRELVALERLDVRWNKGLRLSWGCVEILVCLPRLKMLAVDAEALPTPLQLTRGVLATWFPALEVEISECNEPG